MHSDKCSLTQKALQHTNTGNSDASHLRAKPVQALLALAESKGLGVPDAPGDRSELKRILWKHARSADKAHSIKASSELIRLEQEEKIIAEPQSDPIEALKEIAKDHPLFALLIARKRASSASS